MVKIVFLATTMNTGLSVGSLSVQERLKDLKKAIKDGDGDGVEFFLSSMTTELVT